MKPIETIYHGCRFRSRLEARWAVFFDALQIRWQYEPQGFEIAVGCDCMCSCVPKHDSDCVAPVISSDSDSGFGLCSAYCDLVHESTCRSREENCPHRIGYLPDFYLPDTETWVEVKGDVSRFNRQLLADATDWGGQLPGMRDSYGSNRGLLLLGDIPYVEEKNFPLHVILQHDKGGWVNTAWFTNHGIHAANWNDTWRHSNGYVYQFRREYFDSSADGLDDETPWKMISECWSINPPRIGLKFWVNSDALVLEAYSAARMARFEHGESGSSVARGIRIGNRLIAEGY